MIGVFQTLSTGNAGHLVPGSSSPAVVGNGSVVVVGAAGGVVDVVVGGVVVDVVVVVVVVDVAARCASFTGCAGRSHGLVRHHARRGS